MRERSALLHRFARLSPRHRHWQQLLLSLKLDPDRLPRPLTEPTKDDFLICGSPRTGTALLVAMLFQPPRCVTVMEPWDAMRLPPAELTQSLRQEVDAGALRRGRLDIASLRSKGDVDWCRDGEKSHSVEVRPTWKLGVKFPAFWRYLDFLPTTKFIVCVRDPYEVVRSYREAGGRLAKGLDYDIPFNHSMNSALLAATDNERARRVLLYDYVNERILPHVSRPEVFVVRYERWHEEPRQLLAEIGAFLGTTLNAPLPTVRPRRADSSYDIDAAVVRELCHTAERLGYSI